VVEWGEDDMEKEIRTSEIKLLNALK